MQWSVFMATFTGVASLAIAPSLRPEGLNVDIRMPNLPPTVDETATRAAWVTSYKYGGKDFEWERPGRWLPTGPEYLDLESLEKGYNAHIMMMHGSDSWLHSSLPAIKRFFVW